MPVCMVGKPCSKPAAGVTLTFTRRGSPARHVVTKSDGTYRIVLAPGHYTVRVVPRSRIERLSPATVVVPAGAFARQRFVIDTGIR